MAKKDEEVADSRLARVGAPEPKPLSADDKKAAQKYWDEKIAYFRDRIGDVTKNIVRLHWEEGKFLIEAGMDQLRYGEDTINRYVEDLKKYNINISASTVYKCIDVAKKMDEKEIKAYIEQGLTWNQLVNVVASGVTKEARIEMAEAVASGEHKDDDEIKAEARKINEKAKKEVRAKGGKVSGKGGAHAKVLVRSTTAVCTGAAKKLDEFKVTFKDIVKLDDEQKKTELLVDIRDAYRAMDEIGKRLAELKELYEELLGA